MAFIVRPLYEILIEAVPDLGHLMARVVRFTLSRLRAPLEHRPRTCSAADSAVLYLFGRQKRVQAIMMATYLAAR